METIPKTLSHNLTSVMLLKNFSIACKNSLALPGIPNRPFNCVEAICKAAAVVKPAVTGYDINSIKKPKTNQSLKKII